MSDEAGAALAEVEPAATPETVATPATETQAAPEVKIEANVKLFTQEEVNDITMRERKKAEAIAERRAMKARIEALESRIPQQVQPDPQRSDRPTRSQFADDDDYVEAMTDWKIAQRDQAQRAKDGAKQAQQLQAKTETIYGEAQKIAGFDREAFDELPLTPAIAAALVDSDAPAKLMHFMAGNPEEVERISKLPPARQAAAIGKLEAKLDAAPPVSKAPPPMKPVGSRGAASNSDLGSASMDEYIAQRAKQGARWAQR